MGAKVVGNTIWISKDLAEKMTPRERKVVLAHELSHYQHKDWIKMLLIKPISLIFPKLASNLIRKIEIRADREAIIKTRDPRAFMSLLNKLERQGDNYPTKEFSLKMADNMAGKI